MSRKDRKLVFDSNAGLSASQRIYSFLAILLVSFVVGAILSSFVLGVYFTTDNLLNFFYGKTDNSQPLEINQTKSVKGKMHLLFVLVYVDCVSIFHHHCFLFQ